MKSGGVGGARAQREALPVRRCKNPSPTVTEARRGGVQKGCLQEGIERVPV